MGEGQAPGSPVVDGASGTGAPTAGTVVRLRPKLLLASNAAVIVLLADVSLVACFPDLDHSGAFYRFASLDSEQGIGTVFAVIQLATAAAGAFLVGTVVRRNHRPWARHWFALGTLLVLVAIDERTAQHERITPTIREQWATHGLLYLAWVVPATLVVLVLVACFAGFTAQLPRPVRGLVVAAAALYVVGALGLEAVGGWMIDRGWAASVPYGLTATLEESLELAGVALLLYAIARYLVEHLPPVWATTGAELPPAVRPGG